MLKLSYSKPFHNTLSASTANIDKVMNFYNLGDKTFETDFKIMEYLGAKSFLTSEISFHLAF